MGLGFKEILIIALIIIVLFGAKRIPELMRGMGSGIKEFKDAVKDDDKKKNDNKQSDTNN